MPLNGSTCHVLFVEDDPTLVHLIWEMSEKHHADLDLHTVSTLREAFASLDSGQRWDVVLLDLVLPDAVGTQAFEAIHTLKPNLPIVVFTGTGTDEVGGFGERLIAAGAADYIQKGAQYEWSEFFWRIRRAAIAGHVRREIKPLSDALDSAVVRLDKMIEKSGGEEKPQ